MRMLVNSCIKEVERIRVRERRKTCAGGQWEEERLADSKIRGAVGMKMAIKDSKRCNIALIRNKLKTVN